MLAQLRLQYPQSCLISELLEIKHGKYIVRALVQVEGVTIATGLGSGETVEIGEDHARERVLAILDLETASSTPAIAPSLQTSIAPLVPPNSVGVTPIVATPVMAEVTSQITPPIVVESTPEVQPLAVEVKSPELTAPVNLSQPEVASEIVQEVVSQEEVSPPPPVTTVEKLEKLAKAERVEKTEKVVPLHIVPDTQPVETYPQPVRAVIPEESSDFSAEKEEKKAKSKSLPVAIPDIKDVMAKTEIEIRRLGWTTQQGRNFLLQRYGKRARTLLSDEELLDFLSYLEDQPVAE